MVPLSITEAELIAVAEAAKEILHLKRLLCDLGFVYDSVVVNCDSGAIHLAKKLAFSSKTKHVKIRVIPYCHE